MWLYSTAGNNGKGTYCELLRNLLGPSACVSIPISDFAKDFALSPLVGKQAIITDENDVGLYIDKVAIMKAVVTGDVITINKKFAQPVNYRFRGMMVQCLNEYPKVKDRSDSFYRRQISSEQVQTMDSLTTIVFSALMNTILDTCWALGKFSSYHFL